MYYTGYICNNSGLGLLPKYQQKPNYSLLVSGDDCLLSIPKTHQKIVKYNFEQIYLDAKSNTVV